MPVGRRRPGHDERLITGGPPVVAVPRRHDLHNLPFESRYSHTRWYGPSCTSRMAGGRRALTELVFSQRDTLPELRAGRIQEIRIVAEPEQRHRGKNHHGDEHPAQDPSDGDLLVQGSESGSSRSAPLPRTRSSQSGGRASREIIGARR